MVNKKYVLEKYPGKGGWTDVQIPEIPSNKRAHFGWVKVRGTIDGFEISKYFLTSIYQRDINDITTILHNIKDENISIFESLNN